MKLAYVTTYDPSNIREWSGLGFYILKALRDAGFETEIISNLRDDALCFSGVKKEFYRKVFGQRYLRGREPRVLNNYAHQVDRALTHSNCDVVLSPGTIPVACLKTKKPIVIWADATFAGMVNFYPSFTNLCGKSLRDGNRMEQEALAKSRLALYTSEWAANSAIKYYNVDAAKVKVVPFGANIESTRSLSEIESLIENKSLDVCRLLFLGVDWVRKGGDKAVAVAKVLRERGMQVQLDVVGCKPFSDPPMFVKQHGFISKADKDGAKLLEQLFTQAHFLILPSKAECYGAVFAEAGSLAVPSLATDVGGIPTAIRDGKNGRTFRLDAAPSEYGDFVESMMKSRDAYRDLALASFREYSDRLNWPCSGKRVYDLIEQFC